MKLKTFLIIFLVVMLVVGSVGVAVRISVADNDESESNKQTEEKEAPADVTEFYDFNTPADWVLNGGTYVSDLGSLYLKFGSFSDNNGTFDFSVNEEQLDGTLVSNLDPYILIGNRYAIEDFSKIVYEVDVTVTDDYPFHIVMRPDYRQGETQDGSQSLHAAVSSGIVYYTNGQFYIKDTNVLLHEISKNSFNFKYVVKTNNTCEIYVDDHLIYEAGQAYSPTCEEIYGFRLSAQYDGYLTIDQTYTASFDNLSVKGYYAEQTESTD